MRVYSACQERRDDWELLGVFGSWLAAEQCCTTLAGEALTFCQPALPWSEAPTWQALTIQDGYIIQEWNVQP